VTISRISFFLCSKVLSWITLISIRPEVGETDFCRIHRIDRLCLEQSPGCQKIKEVSKDTDFASHSVYQSQEKES